MNYYQMSFPADTSYGVGFPENTEEFDVPDKGKIDHWEPILLILQDGPFSDYQGNLEAARLCSSKLKKIVEEYQSPIDEIQWLSMYVRDANGKQRDYFILHFPFEYDVIDWGKSITIQKNTVVKPVLSKEKVKGHQIFNYTSGAFITCVVSEDLKRAIHRAGCTGMSFLKIPLV